MNAISILTYHSIDLSGSVISTAPETFRSQMMYLKSNGFQAISVATMLDAWNNNSAIAPRSVVLTFDDAYQNFSELALPVLIECGFHATVFAVSEKLGGFNDWSGASIKVPKLQLMDRVQLQNVNAMGFEIGAHSSTHRALNSVGEDAMRTEVVTCKHALEQRLGTAVSTFAYPFGAVSAAAQTLVAGTYRAGFGTRMAVATGQDAVHTLPRVDMYYFRDPRVMQLFGTTAGDMYTRLRAAGRALREVAR